MAFFDLLSQKKDETPPVISVKLKAPDYHLIDLSQFQRGIDNLRVDVQISEVFQTIVRRTARNTIETGIDKFRGQKTWDQLAQPSVAQFKRFHVAYAQVMEASVHQARRTSNLMMPWLARTAALTFIRTEVATELDRAAHILKNDAKNAVGTNKAGIIQAKTVWLVRYRHRLFQLITGMLIKQLIAVETGDIAKLQQAMLNINEAKGIKLLLSNPLIKAEAPDGEELMLTQYLLLPWAGKEEEAFASINNLLNSFFTQLEFDVAPDPPMHCNDQVSSKLLARFFRNAEQADIVDWRDNPRNIEKIFSFYTKKELPLELEKLSEEPRRLLEQSNPSREKYFNRFVQLLKENNILPLIIASYSVLEAYKALSGQLPIRLIFQYLQGGDAKKRAVQRIMGMASAELSLSPKAIGNILDKVKPKHAQERELILAFLDDFIRYRRDLKLWASTESLGQQVNVLTKEEDLKLSSANQTLYRFLPPDETKENLDDIEGHVIIKADVRGSIGITNMLREKGLNPATHFSHTFFDPISELLPQYGAEKVFVEGDAVILSFLERASDQKKTAVARACGLSRKIIQIVDIQNRHHEENGLPKLEIGIGIVYASEPPTFLYDGEHKITISPAIGRSDRLSSCSKVVRPILESEQSFDRLNHVDVFALSEDNSIKNDKGETHLRYNVNGIELDNKAFVKLKQEIGLRASNVKLPSARQSQRYIVGKFPDAEGHFHPLVLRQGIVSLWSERTDQRKALKQFFFEVVADDARYLPLSQMAERQ